MNYEFAYRIGFHPWEDAEDQPEFQASLTRLVEAEENGHGAPYGRALDLGTGSAIWAIYLAKRGWQVSGVDIVDKALERAFERVQDARVDVELVRFERHPNNESILRNVRRRFWLSSASSRRLSSSSKADITEFAL